MVAPIAWLTHFAGGGKLFVHVDAFATNFFFHVDLCCVRLFFSRRSSSNSVFFSRRSIKIHTEYNRNSTLGLGDGWGAWGDRREALRGTRAWHMVWGILVGWCAMASPPPWVHGCTHRRWYIWGPELVHTSFLHAWSLLQLKIRTGRLATFPWGIHGFSLTGAAWCCSPSNA